MGAKTIGTLVVLVIALIVLTNAAFTVNETKQALVLQLGQWVRTIQQPGLHFKIPFFQNVVQYERRLLRINVPPSTFFSKDKKQLLVDSYARYRIVDPLAFFRAFRTELAAEGRLGDIINSNLREELARDDQSEIIKKRRSAIMEQVTLATKETAKVQNFGIEVVDIRIKRVEFPREIAQSIYGRMNAEREKEAKKFRSEGSEEEAKIKAEADKQRTILLAEATKKAQEVRGEGDAKAVEIYAQALEQDPEFYAFQRTLEAYKQFLSTNTTVVLSSETDLFRYLDNPQGKASSPSGRTP